MKDPPGAFFVQISGSFSVYYKRWNARHAAGK